MIHLIVAIALGILLARALPWLILLVFIAAVMAYYAP
jgi:hypothetical protein